MVEDYEFKLFVRYVTKNHEHNEMTSKNVHNEMSIECGSLLKLMYKFEA